MPPRYTVLTACRDIAVKLPFASTVYQNLRDVTPQVIVSAATRAAPLRGSPSRKQTTQPLKINNTSRSDDRKGWGTSSWSRAPPSRTLCYFKHYRLKSTVDWKSRVKHTALGNSTGVRMSMYCE